MPRIPDCRYKGKCTKKRCKFNHKKFVCKYGANCNKDTCRFKHKEITSEKIESLVEKEKYLALLETEHSDLLKKLEEYTSLYIQTHSGRDPNMVLVLGETIKEKLSNLEKIWLRIQILKDKLGHQ